MKYKGLKLSYLHLLHCPHDDGTFSCFRPSDDYIWDGLIFCNTCGKSYKIENGIVRLDCNIVEENMVSEIVERDSEALIYDTRLDTRFYKEVRHTLSIIGDVKGKKILEYGCGTGRFGRHLTQAELVVGVDFSFDSLKVFAEKYISCDLVLICADVTNLKLLPDIFDLVISTQVLEHLPGDNYRALFYKNIFNYVKNNGQVVVSAYHQDIRRRLVHSPAEGLHKGKIFYHYFRAQELKKEIGQFFVNSNPKAYYVDITLPLEIKLAIGPAIGGILSRVVSYIPILRQFGHLILISIIVKK